MDSQDIGTTSFDVDLQPEESGGDTLRSQAQYSSSSLAPRPFSSSRSKNLSFQAKLVLAVHGWRDDGGIKKPVSLIVVDFYFVSPSAARRFKYAKVDFTFKSEDPDCNPPRILDIAPSQYTYIQETETSIKNTKSIGASLSLGTPGVGAGASLTWDSLESKPAVVSHAVVAGNVYSSRRSHDPDSATWVLRENASAKSGIPTRLQVAMRLERDKENPDGKFLAVVDIKAEVDFASSVKRLFASNPRNDPIVLDPKTNFGSSDRINQELLVESDLDELVVFSTIGNISPKAGASVDA